MNNLFNMTPEALERRLSSATDAFLAVVTTYGLKVIGALVIFLVGWILAGIAQKAIQRAGARSRRIDVTIVTFTASTAKYAVIVFTIIAVLASFGVQTTSFVAVLGAAGLAIGLALQGTLSHVASGLLLVIFRPFRVGDYIEAGGVAGTVRSITLFLTEVDTAENIRVVIPNGLIWSGTMKNLTENRTRRIELRFLLSYVDDTALALRIVRDIVANEPRVLPHPRPQAGVQTFADTGITLIAHVWTAVEDFQDVVFDLNRAVKDAFDKEGFTMSFAQRKSLLHPAPLPPPSHP